MQNNPGSGAAGATGSTAPAAISGIPFAKYAHPMWVFDPETLAFLEVNDAAIRQYGYTRSEFLGMTIRDIRPPEDVSELVRDDRSKGVTTAATWRHRIRNGVIVKVAITSWQVTYGGKPAELVLARWEDGTN